MAPPRILTLITPLKHMSPFDVNMALDAGYADVIAYSNATIEDVYGLIQDAIFSEAGGGWLFWAHEEPFSVREFERDPLRLKILHRRAGFPDATKLGDRYPLCQGLQLIHGDPLYASLMEKKTHDNKKEPLPLGRVDSKT